MMPMDWTSVASLVAQALAEDLGRGDLTTEALVSQEAVGTASIAACQPAVLAGLPVAEMVFRSLDATLAWQPEVEEGQQVEAGTRLVTVRARLRALLSGERTALNFLQRLSGIATLTAQFVARAAPYGVEILDTRKTTPLHRALEKYAVRVGGGRNHRMGLYDAVLIKDNHIAAAGGVGRAVALALARVPATLRVEVEVRSLAQAREAVEAGAAALLLDHMPPEEMRALRHAFGEKLFLEASGNVTLDNVEAIAQSGVNAISVGALTHSAPAADFSMQVRGD